MRNPAGGPVPLLLALGILLVSTLATQAQPTAFTGATLYPIDGPPIEDGVLVVENGKITALGTASTVQIPTAASVVDLAGKVMIPGLVDTHTHIGRVEGGDRSGPLHPEVRVLDAVDVRDPTFVKALAGGITTVNVMPGSGHLMSGQTVYLKIRRTGGQIDDWTFCGDVLSEICGGMKMANGTNSIGQKPFPGTRAKSAALARELFVEALDYRRKAEAAAKKQGDGGDGKKPDRDLGLEAVLQVLDGQRIVHFHTHRHNDVMTILRLSREFGFQPVLHHVSDASLVAEALAAAGIGASITGVDSPGGKEEALHIGWAGPADLERAGVAVAFNTDDGITDSRYFLRSGAMAVRFGMSPEGALAGLTLTPAKMLGLDDRVGSLTVGKDADFVILSGEPFSVYTRVEETWVEGHKVFDLDDPEDRKIAVGGPGAYPGGSIHLHDALSEWD